MVLAFWSEVHFHGEAAYVIRRIRNVINEIVRYAHGEIRTSSDEIFGLRLQMKSNPSLIRQSRISSRSDFIHQRWIYPVRMTDLIEKTTSEEVVFFGGDGGNRNRVRKPVHTTFSGCSQSFDIPSHTRRLTGLYAQYPLMRDGIRGCSAVHVHCWSTPESEPQYSQVRRVALRSL